MARMMTERQAICVTSARAARVTGRFRSDRSWADTEAKSLRRRSLFTLAGLVLAVCLIAAPASSSPAAAPPRAHAAATCADYPNQAAAQRAADTRDADGDGVYCESLPCPCAGPRRARPPRRHRPPPPPPSAAASTPPASSRSPSPRPSTRTSAATSSRRRRHGWPRTLVLNRPGADARRDRLLEDVPTRDGFDRDEYPPAVGRGRGKGLERGRHPRGWKADVAYVPSAREPLPRLRARHQAAALLRRDAVPLRLLLGGARQRLRIVARARDQPRPSVIAHWPRSWSNGSENSDWSPVPSGRIDRTSVGGVRWPGGWGESWR